MSIAPNEIPHLIVGSCMEVHRELGPGLPEAVYRDALAREFRMRELMVHRDHPVAVVYKGEQLEHHFTVEFVVESLVLVAVRAVDELSSVDKETVNNQLRLAGLETGMLVNFNVSDIRKGIRRMILSREGSEDLDRKR